MSALSYILKLYNLMHVAYDFYRKYNIIIHPAYQYARNVISAKRSHQQMNDDTTNRKWINKLFN